MHTTKNRIGVFVAAAAAVVALTVMVWQSGIGAAFFRAEKDRPRPALDSVVGTWRLLDSSAESWIRLSEDGRFAASELGFEDPDGKHSLSGEGRWRLIMQQAWMLSLEFSDGGSTALYVDFAEGDFESAPPVGFSQPVGDLDSTERRVWRQTVVKARH